ncbi:MGH1-like glycoside hydrolase domain-containing protein [Jiangella alkaliphila]|uniref:Neutral trehalase n=1 Tax=Jiangella alkaliphila TaxID=419479 RepID=A0A1H2KLL8_9ACTN|nr:trehalase family glycosidase [Jiangella alkaliphila]SDU69251.1 Neutral trehalase [Jiangella alkaliphila]
MIAPASLQYLELQRSLSEGWNTWDTRSLLRHVRLPDGLGLTLGLHELYRGTSLQTVQIGRREEGAEEVALGPHAIRGDFSEVTVTWADLTIRVAAARTGDDLVLLVTPLDHRHRPGILTVGAGYLWNRDGVVRRDDGVLAATSGETVTPIHVTGEPIDDPYADVVGPYLAVELAELVGVSTGTPRTVEEIDEIVRQARAAHCPPPESVADEHREIVRDSIAWNTVYEPAGDRVVTTVSRLWNVGKRGGYALFCWDAFFNALLADVSSTELAYANAVEMCREVTPDGFVPNVAQGTGRKTFDGSQPPVGSMVCWELYLRHRDRWFLEEVFEVLLSWNRWWWKARHNGVMLSPGSTTFTPEYPSPQDIPRIGKHFGATCETGADDHPVLRDAGFDPATGLLDIDDVGLNAEYVMDCEALAQIAETLGRTAEAAEVIERGRAVARLVDERLWDDEGQIYRSHFTATGKPTAWLAPMSFFPLLAGIGLDGRAKAMADRYLQDPRQFGGPRALPSSPRSEPAPAPGEHSYWIGRAWPPINFLVFLGLRRAGLDAEATWLAERSGELILDDWRRNRHIHENYSSEHDRPCDAANSEPFHSWGALLSLTALAGLDAAGGFALTDGGDGLARHG